MKKLLAVVIALALQGCDQYHTNNKANWIVTCIKAAVGENFQGDNQGVVRNCSDTAELLYPTETKSGTTNIIR